MQSGWEAAGQLLHLRRDHSSYIQRIGVRGLVDGDTRSRLAVELEVLRIGLRPKVDARNILDLDQTAALSGLILNDDFGELIWIVEPRQDVDRILKLLVLRCRRHANLPRCHFLALLLNGRNHVFRHQSVRV